MSLGHPIQLLHQHILMIPRAFFFSSCGLGAIGGDVASLFAPFPPGLAACVSFYINLGSHDGIFFSGRHF